MAKMEDLRGQRFGKLTVVELEPEREHRYAVYRCRCDCGGEIRVDSRRLRRGSVQGCAACWDFRGKAAQDLTGQRFGSLTVVGLAQQRIHNRRSWSCRCDCGGQRDVPTNDLKSGGVTSCGCVNRRSYPYNDLTGRKVGRLTVLEKTENRTAKGSVLWRCRCECGTERELSEDALAHGKTISCGCYRETELPKKLNAGLHRVEGTCVEALQRKKRADNTSGYTGITKMKNGKYKASITFKKKRYHLGTFETLEEAVKARKRGEEMHDEFLDAFYGRYPELAGRRKEATEIAD